MGKAYMGIPREKIPWYPEVAPDKCIGCSECVETCPNGVLTLNEETNKVEVIEAYNCVVLCDKCAKFCPQDAIVFPNREEIKTLLGVLLRELNGKNQKR
jgi:NAD-dependent dihydropyrimidine dehydrogenase PreA subunit